MAEEKYPSNSNKLREASLIREDTEIRTAPLPKKTEDGNVGQKEKEKPNGIVRRRNVSTAKMIFAELFPDGFNGLKEKFIWEMLVPRIKRLLSDGWDDIGDVLFQDTGRSRYSNSHTPYNSLYSGSRSTTRRTDDKPYVYRGVYDYQEIVYDSGYQAERLLRTLNDILANYGVVTLLDYNEEVGNQTHPGQANYGWISLKNARIERAHGGGFVVVMPRPVQIDTRN